MAKVLMVLVAAVMGLTLVACSGSDDAAYKKGYDAGFSEGGTKKFAEGYQRGLEEGKRQAGPAATPTADSVARDAYDRGYKDGLAAGSKTPPAPPPAVKILSQTMSANWVSGELQNVSNKGLDVVLVGALLDAAGNVIGTSSTVWRGYVQPQEKRVFQLMFNAPGIAAADFELKVIWH